MRLPPTKDVDCNEWVRTCSLCGATCSLGRRETYAIVQIDDTTIDLSPWFVDGTASWDAHGVWVGDDVWGEVAVRICASK